MIIRQIRNFIRQAARDRMVRRVSSALACLVVFVTAYMLILPAITLSGRYPVLEAEERSAAAGETLTVRVRAEAPESAGDRIVTLVMDSGNAGLSERYVFDEDGTTVIVDAAGQEILLHRSARTDREDVVDYWFELSAGESAEFDLELQDRISVAEITEAAREAGFLTPEGTWRSASASDAEAAEETASPSDAETAAETATASDAEKTGTPEVVHSAGAEKSAVRAAASSSDADKTVPEKADAPQKTASFPDAGRSGLRKTASSSNAGQAGEEADEDGFLADGEILNDLDMEPEGTAAEITASLLVRAGCGESLQAAVRDAEKNAEKRGDASAEFHWKAEISYELLKSVFRKSILAGDGKTYQVTVTYSIDAGIPEGSELNVSEIVKDTDPGNSAVRTAASETATVSDAVYDGYVSRAERVLGFEEGTASRVRLFDIRIVDRKVEKVAIQAPVNVEIVLTDENGEKTASPETQVVHFADDAEIPEVIRDVEIAETESEGESVALTFDAPGFSVYAIVDAPEPAVVDLKTVQDLQELRENTAEGFLLSVSKGYFLNSMNGNDCFNVSTSVNTADVWYFEATAAEDRYRVYTFIKDEDGNPVKRYIKQKSNNLVELTGDPDSAIAFDVSLEETGKFSLKMSGQNRWLQYSNGGSGIRLYTDKNNAANSRIIVTYASSRTIPDDPYGLDGKTWGIAYHNDTVISAALTADPKTVSEKQRLAGLSMLMKPDVLDNDGILLVAANSDIQEWTFKSLGEDKYYITAEVGGQKKYLTIRGEDVTLEDTPDETGSVIQALPGSGANAGKWHFTVNGRSLNLMNSADNGFNAASGSGATTWMNLVEKSVLNDDDFKQYNAKKVSVSDTSNVYNGQQIIIYTRIWNDTAKKYEFYAVDHDGSLIRCYDTGDGIEWVGTQVNTALWNFTEYTNPDGTPNYYYELQNSQYQDYIAPQASKGQILSGETIGINLNGRRYGENNTTIIAWDKNQYSYSGLKAENGHVVACPLSEAEDFYFAVVNPIDVGDRLTEVDTIDGKAYGIDMRMVDFNSTGHWSDKTPRDIVQNPFFGGDNNQAGLLTTDLGEDGYPVTTDKTNTGSYTDKDGHSLGELFTDMTDVNHLFIKSIYNESGYFEYDSTSNFAHLNEDGEFTVYNQLGAIGDYPGAKGTGTHGQFMPYDSLTPGKYCTFANETDVLANPLNDLDPRKGEKLYNIGNRTEVDYFFGMEMSAEFTQTPNGLDAWGHDIIFEFSGDDDFWLYVDGELVLDLGGVHSAMTGSINFRTGQVKSSRLTGQGSTLYDIFRSNYEARGMTETEISTRLEELFETKIVDGKTVHVFKDFSNHSMKMFYMERGAGASNLHMRFNLAAVKPGTVTLSKTLSGTENPSNSMIEFPYQIVYRRKKDGEAVLHLLGEAEGDTDLVTYKDSIRTVPYRNPYKAGNASYSHVFLLKPGETAIIDLPDDATEYYIVECGVDPNVYDAVKVNGTPLDGTIDGQDPDLKNYATTEASMEDRPAVEYDNHVKEGAKGTLSITKILYDTDGTTILSRDENATPFDFRLFLGNSTTDEEDLPRADQYPYFVKDPEGHYCRWNALEQQFDSLEYTEYDALAAYLEGLTPTERDSIEFRTSMYGSISMIPTQYTAEVRDLVIGTKWRAEEWDSEIPKGYTMRLEDGYTRTDRGSEEKHGTVPIGGIMVENEDPKIQIRNQKGWGLTVEKVWTDKDFMESHDPIYFAVYVRKTDPDTQAVTYELVPESVRTMTTDQTSIYYFFDNLKADIPFENYLVFEVTLDPYGNPVRIPDDGTGTLTIGGKPVGGSYKDGFEYTVSYERGEPTLHNENVRTDTVTNSRPGLKIVKTEWNYRNPLAGAVFTLVDSDGAPVAAESYLSGSDGLVTIAYLNPGTEGSEAVYKLQETATPRGFMGAEYPLEIRVNEDGEISVDTTPPAGYEQHYQFISVSDATASDAAATETVEMPVIIVRNRRTALKVLKTDPSEEPEKMLEGVHFALYRQVTDAGGNKRKDFQPMPGYGDLVTNADGILEAVSIENPDLVWGNTYYLTETQAAPDYDRLEEDICFTIDRDGTVKVNSEGHSGWLSFSDEDLTGKRTWILTIPNGKMKKVSFMKVDIADQVHSRLDGAEFDLYRVINGVREETPYLSDLVSGLVSGDPGMLAKDGNIVFELPKGTYHLVETKAPDGYQLRTDAVVIEVTGETDSESKDFGPGPHLNGVKNYDEGTILSYDGSGEKYDAETKVYTLKISNSAGHMLPSTGGGGTRSLTLAGLLLMAAALLMYLKLQGRAAYYVISTQDRK